MLLKVCQISVHYSALGLSQDLQQGSDDISSVWIWIRVWFILACRFGLGLSLQQNNSFEGNEQKK